MNKLAARLDAYEKLVRLDKPIGILLLLWPTLWGLWLAARGVPNLLALWLFFLGTVLMRSAGCAINDYADRDFDAHVERTRARPLPAGLIRPWEALAVAAALAAAAFVIVLQFNTLTVMLSFAALAIAAIYPFTKRFFWMPQAWLGVAFGFGIPMAFAALTGRVPPLAWALLAANVFWTLAYDTEYAMVDREDDRKLGLRTAAILFGRHDVAAVMLCYVAFLASMLAIGLWQRFGPFYFAGIVAAALIAGYHYRLIRERTREGCFKAFRHNNWIGAAIFASIALDHVPSLRAIWKPLGALAAAILVSGCGGAPYAVKLSSDPTQFELRDGRLFIFGDIIGHEMWLLDWKTSIERADHLWPQIRDKGWRAREGYGQPRLGVPGEGDDPVR